MAERLIDLRSDTLTMPTPEMRRAMAEAELGDDVFHEDPTVNRLEALAAERMGKEAAVLVTSGTQGNLVGVVSHTQRGDEVICGDQSHVFHYEVAGCAVVGSIQLRTVPNVNGMLDPEAVRSAIRPADIHNPRTAVVCLENTHNRNGGVALTPEQTASVAAVAHERGIPVHLDGARVFNAAVALGVEVRRLTAPVDSVTFCLSKGLAAPVGSVLCGSKEYIQVARKYRKLLGGGMREAGVIAAAGVVALTTMVERLAEDHANARRLAGGLAEIPGIEIDPGSVQTNLVFFDVTAPLGAPGLVAGLRERGVSCMVNYGRRIRMVTHYGIERSDIEHTLRAIQEILVGVPVGAR
jgi:threonine aldolase